MRSGHWRSLLFCPGDRPDRIAKAIAAKPGAVIVDLEDSVHPSHRAEARRQAVAALTAADDPEVTRIVRVNAAGSGEIFDDLAAVVGPWLDAVMLPKAGGPDEVGDLDGPMRELERAGGIAPGSIGIVPVIEDCAALRTVYETAASSSRVIAMAFAGAEEGDFMADLGGRWTPEGTALHYAKSRFLCEVRAAGDLPALDGPSMHLDDPAIWESECALSRTLGFDGKVAIHPRQLDTIHRAFTPSPEEVDEARQLVAALDAAAADGAGVARHRGKMIDSANGRAARRILSRAGVTSGPARTWQSEGTDIGKSQRNGTRSGDGPRELGN
ncbi:CoA ester lyase [Nonomuraea antimicrobica]|uniref:CoA ester lyase n=1 Tax=Nonomuraea antimicrobica TaxID=561173 RepID=A0ABP7E5X7_9ACTN